MALEAGTSLLHYRLVEKIGEGGMGVVWKAVDSSLGREVAIKVLPAVVAADPERLARLEREARVLASLSHPSIAAVFGLHEAHGTRFLAMEYVPGEDLAARLARGPVPVDEAIPIGLAVAEALEAAHEQGIVHRDLKPANIVVRADGAVKVLDFGLAKALAPQLASGDANPSLSPTITSLGTVAGMILGTAAYMSPEQARGKPVDRRADIWALGCVLYEMLTGRRLFAGETVSDTLAAVLRADVDLSTLPAETPANVRKLVARCLDRDPRTRLRDAGEARLVLAAPDAPGARAEAPLSPRRVLVGLVAATALALVAGVVAGRSLFAPRDAAPAAPLAFEIRPRQGRLEVDTASLSPDGTQLLFITRDEAGESQLWLRPLDALEPRLLPGTAGVRYPFWSPDGKEIGFFAGDQLKRLALDGTAPRPVVNAPRAMGGAWGADGVIVFGTENGPIYKTSVSGGGAPVAITTVDPIEQMHVWPAFLPDGRRFVFLADASSNEGHRLHLADVSGGPTKVLFTDIHSKPIVDDAGYLMWVRDTQLLAYPFDPQGENLGQDPDLVVDGITPIGSQHLIPVSVSRDGKLAWQRGAQHATLIRYDLAGKELERFGAPSIFSNPVISPDGTRLAFEIYDGELRPVQVLDLARGVRTPVSEATRADSAVWSADGTTLYFDAQVDAAWKAFRKRVDGGEEPELLGGVEGVTDFGVLDASPDGRWLLGVASVAGQRWDLVVLDLADVSAGWKPWLGTPASEPTAVFSRDSRLVAFTSDASGRVEVYVSPFGAPDSRRWLVSSSGGQDPRFAPDGKHLYYRASNDTLMVVAFEAAGDRFVASAPRPVLKLTVPAVPYIRNVYDVAPDGKSLIVLQAFEEDEPRIFVRTEWRQKG